MNLEQVREYALSLSDAVTEELFVENFLDWRIGGKWFMLMQLDAPEPRVAVKVQPDYAIELRERYDGITPAYHMNKKHWCDIYLNRIDDSLVKELIKHSFDLVRSKLPKSALPK